MSVRGFWALSLSLAVCGWLGVVFVSGVLPPSVLGLIVLLPLIALAVSGTAAPFVWLAVRRLRARGIGERPALALRASGWLGLWVAACVWLRIAGLFSWVIAATLAVVLVLLESFLLQNTKRAA
ncbi:MAG: hypothetical protein FJ011_18830 [Chloroflexi bacterium]|nr:hypothetical protein [Chloroflexota bacterium]